ncbi:hypothetical protein AC1031_022098 [Aphanomyces cochlioides]|nr:hypothetical protein AC1031_022098 [Aphanomyces cochlioides]
MALFLRFLTHRECPIARLDLDYCSLWLEDAAIFWVPCANGLIFKCCKCRSECNAIGAHIAINDEAHGSPVTFVGHFASQLCQFLLFSVTPAKLKASTWVFNDILMAYVMCKPSSSKTKFALG